MVSSIVSAATTRRDRAATVGGDHPAESRSTALSLDRIIRGARCLRFVFSLPRTMQAQGGVPALPSTIDVVN
jgi:hypothetical protein